MLQVTSAASVLIAFTFSIRLRQGAMQLQNIQIDFMLNKKTSTLATTSGLCSSFVRL